MEDGFSISDVCYEGSAHRGGGGIYPFLMFSNQNLSPSRRRTNWSRMMALKRGLSPSSMPPGSSSSRAVLLAYRAATSRTWPENPTVHS